MPTVGFRRWTGISFTGGRFRHHMCPRSKAREMPASESDPAIAPDRRFDRYQEADVSQYGKTGTGPHDHLFADF